MPRGFSGALASGTPGERWRQGRRGMGCRASAGAAGAGVAPLQGAALVLGHAAPDAGILAGLDGPLQADVHHFAAAAHSLGLLDLQDRWAGVPDGEEQLRVLFEAGSAVAPVHLFVLLVAG